jgi:hypothetical protein
MHSVVNGNRIVKQLKHFAVRQPLQLFGEQHAACDGLFAVSDQTDLASRMNWVCVNTFMSNVY